MERAVAALDAFWRANGYPPSLRQLADSMGLRAASNVMAALAAATECGLVYATPETERIRIYVPWWVKIAIASAPYPPVSREAV
jgi:hypothetical protein